MFPEELLMMNMMATSQFGAATYPLAASSSCSSGWKLKVEVNVKAGVDIWPTDRITILLTRVGAHTGWKKGEEKNLSRTRQMAGTSTDARFEGILTKRYKIQVLIEEERWFHWISTELDQTLDDGDDLTVQLEITPVLVLVEMTSISEIKSRFTDGTTCEADYKMTKTVTAAQIQGVVGEANLREGHVNAPRMAARAAKLEALLGFDSPPYFAVIDINKSHQMSFFLACLAFHQHGRHERKLVINFDNHADYRNSGENVSFDAWGQGFFTNAEALAAVLGGARVVYTICGQTQILWDPPQRGTVKQLYHSSSRRDGTEFSPNLVLAAKDFRVDAGLWVTAHKNPAGDTWELRISRDSVTAGQAYPFSAADLQTLEDRGVLQQTEAKPTRRLYSLTAAGPAAATLAANLQQPVTTMYRQRDQDFLAFETCPGSAFLDPDVVGDLSQTDVYVTVDRDVSRGSFTFWNDGYLSAAQMRDAVRRCLAYLKTQNANLVGFDVAGLPDTYGRSTALGLHGPIGEGQDPGDQAPAIIQQARDDIAYFLQQVQAYGPTG